MKPAKGHFINKMTVKVCLVLFILVFFSSTSILAAVKISPIPPPPPTAKLRIYVIAVTSGVPKSGFWPVSQEEYADRMAKYTDIMLKNQGIYEVVSAADVQAALGGQNIAGWEWTRNNWALAKDAGKALHADYVLCIERSWKIHFQQDMTLFNLSNGRQFSVSNYLPPRWEKANANIEMIRINFRTLFRDAKGDFLHTALTKGKLSEGEIKPVTTAKEAGTVPPEVIAKAETPQKPETNASIKTKTIEPSKSLTPQVVSDRQKKENQLAFEKEMEAAVLGKNKKPVGPQLVVYDFDATEKLRIVGLILAEALREELYKLGGVVLINRENMVQVMEERKLQQSGLVNEKQAIKLGEWMAASEAVTGNIAIIGSTSVLQAKRIDIKTMGTISLGSLKCKTGAEDELLNSMPELARKLTQLQKN
jgi:hypothetical protein